MTTIQQGVITLIKSAITGERYPLPEGFALEDADQLICSQSLLPMAYQGAYTCGISPETAIMQRYRTKYYQNLIRSEQQLRAAEQLYRVFEENGIDYLPMKGCILKKLYPQPELRPMGDADILIRMDQYDKIRPLMQQLGYEEKEETHHELVWQNGRLHVELHKCLFAPTNRDLFRYFGDGWSMAKKQAGHCWELSNEDTFLHMFAHMTKHYRSSGIGARHFVDLYVYRNRFPEMDEGYIEREAAELGFLEFYRNVKQLLRVWFQNAPVDDKTSFITQYIFASGNWGDQETRFISEQLRRTVGKDKIENSQRTAWVKALFPPLQKMQHDYPILFKCPYLYPLFWVPRWVRGILRRPGQIRRKMQALSHVSDEKVIQRKEALTYVGLHFEP